jgi:hypothetical protein
VVQFLALGRRQAILAAALVTVGLRNPIADRLRRRFKLPGKLLRSARHWRFGLPPSVIDVANGSH